MSKDNWIIKAFLMTFFIAIIFSSISNVIVDKCSNIIILVIINLLFISIGVLFDIIGTAVLTANESTFHAKSSKKIKGGKHGVYLIKNSNRIASICNDIIGDICGIVSGSISAMIGLLLSNTLNISSVISLLIVSSLVSSITVGGKAIGKKYSIKNSDEIVFLVSKILTKFKREI